MNKKIIALSLALVVMITCFTACKKKRDTITINGNEVIAVTDKDGNPVINENNEVVAVVTDREGEILTYADGEDQTYYVPIRDALVIDGVAHGSHYKLNVLKGWTAGNGDRINKDDTENKCYISFVENKKFEKNESITTYLEALDEQNKQLVEAFKSQGYTLTVEKSSENISAKNIRCETRTYKVVDGSGNVTHYAENYYFSVENTLYSVNYVCENGIGYDESFDFSEYLKTNFTFVE